MTNNSVCATYNVETRDANIVKKWKLQTRFHGMHLSKWQGVTQGNALPVFRIVVHCTGIVPGEQYFAGGEGVACLKM